MTCWANVKEKSPPLSLVSAQLVHKVPVYNGERSSVFVCRRIVYITSDSLPVQECSNLHFLHVVQPIKAMDKRF